MKIRVVYPEGKFYSFFLLDEDGEKIGEIYAHNTVAGRLPTVDSLTRFQGARLVVDGRSLKRLRRDIETEPQE